MKKKPRRNIEHAIDRRLRHTISGLLRDAQNNNLRFAHQILDHTDRVYEAIDTILTLRDAQEHHYGADQ